MGRARDAEARGRDGDQREILGGRDAKCLDLCGVLAVRLVRARSAWSGGSLVPQE